MSDNTPQSPGLSPRTHRESTRMPTCDDPLDRMEELAKLQERRQQRLMQLRELRQGKPVSSWASDLSDNAKLSPCLSSPKYRNQRSMRALSKSLPPKSETPQCNTANPLIKSSSTKGRIEGRGRSSMSSMPVVPFSREESPHPARLLTRTKSVDAPADAVDSIKRPLSKTRHPSSQKPVRKSTSNSKQTGSTARAIEVGKESPNSPVFKTSEIEVRPGIRSCLNKGNGHAKEQNTPEVLSGENQKLTDSSSGHLDKNASSQVKTLSGSTRRLSTNSNLSFLKLFDTNSDFDYTKSAEELSHLIAAMQAEFQTLRDAKAHAEATADKLRTDFTLHQQESEAQLLSLSSENERLRSAEFELKLKLDQEVERAKKAENERCILRSRLLRAQNEKISAETRVTVLEVENVSLRKTLDTLTKSGGYKASVVVENDLGM